MLLTFLAGLAFAADPRFEVSYGVLYEDSKLSGRSKYFSGAVSEDLTPLLRHQYEVGVYTGQSRDRNPGGFGGWSIGVRPKDGPLFLEALWGPYLVTSSDNTVNSYLQFGNKLGFGYQGQNGTSVGFYYRHLSNAGIQLPNKGRDFITVNLSVPIK